MAKKINVIPATRQRFTAEPVVSRRKRRVAGYARVSTNHEEQATSYEAQVKYYTEYIKGRDDWEFVDIYTDEGIEIYFEKENIWTLDAKGELLITIMSSLAQEESRSISENTTWGWRRRFADGKAKGVQRKMQDSAPYGGRD